MTKRVRLVVSVSILVGAMTSGAAQGQTDISKFPLAKALPADVYIAIAGKANPERAFLDQHWGEVWQAFRESGILESLWDMVTDAVPDEDLEAFEQARERFGGLLSAVAWGELCEKEMVYAGRFNSLQKGVGLISESVLMGRTGKDAAKANYAALKAILEELNGLCTQYLEEGKATLVETKKDGLVMTTLGPAEMPDIGITVAQWKDLVMLSVGGNSIMQDSINLLKGSSEKPALIDTARFKKAIAKLPPAEDSVVFFDAERLFGAMRSFFDAIVKAQEEAAKAAEGTEAAEAAEDGGPAGGDDPAILKIIGSVLEDISFIDYVATVEWTEGYRVFSESITALKPGAKKSPLYGVFAGNKPIENFGKFIPKEAENFSCTSGINLSKLYNYLLDFVENKIPWGKGPVASFKAMQEQWELDIDKDVLKLFAGTWIEVSIGDGLVWMAKVTDEEKTSAQVSRLLAAVNSLLTGMVGEESVLITTQVEVAGKPGFTQISHPALMMLGVVEPFVVGCADGYLLVGSSARVVATCLETSRGEHPNITKNDRWRKEGLAPKRGAVDSISFADESNMAQELQGAVGGLSMVLGMAGMAMLDAPAEVRSFVSALPPILGKLVPVVGKLDFYQSSASYSTFDGSRWHSRTVQNYKPPKPKAPAAKKVEEL